MTQPCIAAHRRDPDRPRRAVDGGYLCIGHVLGLKSDIVELARLHTALAGVLQRQSGWRFGGRSTPGPFVDPNVVAVRDYIAATLCGWARVVVEDRGLTHPADEHPAVVGAWLLRHADWLANQPFADEIVTEFTDLRNRARGLIDLPLDKTRIPIPLPCPDCGGAITAYIPTSVDYEAGMQCDGCETWWPAAQWLRLGRRMLIG